VADLVPASRLATAYGAFAAFQAVAALVGGGLAGWLYDTDRAALVAGIAVAEAVALVLLAGVLVRSRHARGGDERMDH
jgi:MFS family permease